MSKEYKERAASDRRDDDLGPPCGWKDRRHKTERRIPNVEETAMSEDEWLSYFGAPSADEAHDHPAHEAAADILGKARS